MGKNMSILKFAMKYKLGHVPYLPRKRGVMGTPK
jgi:hypothetical protein